MLRNKLTKLVMLTLIMVIMGLPTIVSAKPSNVIDCIEEGDCLEVETEIKSDEAEETDQIVAPKKSSSLPLSILKMVFALLLILLIIYVMLRIFNKKNRLMSQTNVLENLGGISIGTNKSIQIVRVGTTLYMIGVGENVELLQEIEDDEVINDLIHSTENSNTEKNTWFDSLFNRDSKKDDNASQSFNKLFSTELTKLKKNRSALIDKHQKKDDKHE